MAIARVQFACVSRAFHVSFTLLSRVNPAREKHARRTLKAREKHVSSLMRAIMRLA